MVVAEMIKATIGIIKGPSIRGASRTITAVPQFALNQPQNDNYRTDRPEYQFSRYLSPSEGAGTSDGGLADMVDRIISETSLCPTG